VIDLHGVLGVEVDEAYPWRNSCLGILADASRFCATPGSTAIFQLHVRFGKPRRTPIMRELRPGVWGSEGSLLDLKYGVRISSPLPDVLEIETDRPCLEWFHWGLQLCALRAGHTFVHAAGVEKDSRAILFPSWGRVGKTALVAHFVQKLGWKLLGDDLVLLSADGTSHGFPRPMVLYPYHKSVFQEVFRKGRGPVAPSIINRFLTHIARPVKDLLRPFPNALQFARAHNPQSVRILPSGVFGMAALSRRSKVRGIVWLERSKDKGGPETHPADPDLNSRILGSTISEYDAWCVSVTNIALGEGIVRFEDYYGGWNRILAEVLTRVEKRVVSIPEDAPIELLPQMVCEAIPQMIARPGL
jgi:hypothetical protein